MHLIWFYSKKNLYKLNKFTYYKKCFTDLTSKWIKTIYFYKEDKDFELNPENVKGIQSSWIEIIPFEKDEEIVIKLKTLNWKIFINTFEEQEINFANTIKQKIWQQITDNPEIFVNKYLQREIIGKKFPETTVKYKVVTLEELRNTTIQDINFLPCIIKPVWWVQSSWVSKVENAEDLEKAIQSISNALEKLQKKRLNKQEILIEEYIDGKMYTVDYFVDQNQNFILPKPVWIELWIDYWIQDFCNVSRIMSHKIESEVNPGKLQDFVEKTVKWWWIRNTFVHHEFKINSKWEFKTIETNWRIWWYRIEMYQQWYDTNLLEFPFFPQKWDKDLKQNIAMFAVYPKQEGIFNWYNLQTLSLIESLKSFHRISKTISSISTQIWFTKNWFWKVCSIWLQNADEDIFYKDYNTVKDKYFEIINK